ncbi:MAG: hypothetical protein WBK44_04580 [Smithellaceae bacterium]|nr:hypothetical protein [Smithellaceae bacterium]
MSSAVPGADLAAPQILSRTSKRVVKNSPGAMIISALARSL